jgi:hypothetical protein
MRAASTAAIPTKTKKNKKSNQETSRTRWTCS